MLLKEQQTCSAPDVPRLVLTAKFISKPTWFLWVGVHLPMPFLMPEMPP